ncbi:MAG: cupin domain-containing protein [Burkholderiales bacterium]|nr:cupin domain-containing protein [Burkholderiales bacterium]
MSTARPRAGPPRLIENERVVVTQWRFPPHGETGWHVHGMDYVVVPQTDGTLLLETKEGDRRAELAVGRPYYRQAGVEHNVVNANDFEFVFIEIEVR